MQTARLCCSRSVTEHAPSRCVRLLEAEAQTNAQATAIRSPTIPARLGLRSYEQERVRAALQWVAGIKKTYH